MTVPWAAPEDAETEANAGALEGRGSFQAVITGLKRLGGLCSKAAACARPRDLMSKLAAEASCSSVSTSSCMSGTPPGSQDCDLHAHAYAEQPQSWAVLLSARKLSCASLHARSVHTCQVVAQREEVQ